MIGSLRTDKREVTIIGAGISGMLAADELDRRGYQVTLIEASQRAGGLISTVETPWGLAETAAHSFLATDPVLRLCERLGVELVATNEDSRARYVFRSGRMRRFPLSPLETLETLIRACVALPRRGGNPEDRTIAEWAERHLGKAAKDYLIDPMTTGIYGARPSEIRIGAAFPDLIVPFGQSLFLKRMRSARRKPLQRKMMAPRGGMGSVTAALERSLKERLGDRFRLGETVRVLPDAANLILAVPAYRAAILLQEVEPRLAGVLADIHYTPLLTATAFAPRNAFDRKPQGVGVLIPEKERDRGALGVLFNSSAFPGRVSQPDEMVSLTLIFGGTRNPDAIRWNEERVESMVREELGVLLGFNSQAKLHISVARAEDAIPRYDERLMAAWDRARQTWCGTPGRLLFSNYTGQVSLRGMIETVAAWQSDCIPSDAVGAPHESRPI